MADESETPQVSEENLIAEDMVDTAVEGDREALSVKVLPNIDDSNVQILAAKLQETLKLQQLILTLGVIGKYLFLANLALAKEAPLLIKVQNLLFSTIKLCDVTALMLQNFQSGANNILEKLRTGYLYLSDGFEDLGRSDIESSKMDVQSMKNHVEKTSEEVERYKSNVVVSAREISRAMKELEDELQDDQQNKRSISIGNGGNKETEDTGCCRGSCCRCCFICWHRTHPYNQVDKSGSEDHEQQGSAVAPNPINRRAKTEQLYLFKLSVASVEEVTKSFKALTDILSELIPVVDGWHRECAQVVEPSLDAGIRKAEGLNEEEKKTYWKSVMFKADVRRYYTRWRGLQVYAESMRTKLKNIRRETNEKYVQNPLPDEAFKMAWKLAEEDTAEEVTDVVSEWKKTDNILAVNEDHPGGYQSDTQA